MLGKSEAYMAGYRAGLVSGFDSMLTYNPYEAEPGKEYECEQWYQGYDDAADTDMKHFALDVASCG